MMTEQDCNSREETDVEWTKEDSRNYVAAIKRELASILRNPDQDPHLFELSPSVARDVSPTRIVIYNGIDYDLWMEKLLGAARSADRRTIIVADLIGKKIGDNPHIWYDPATVSALGKRLSDTLIAEDPANKAG